MHMRHELQQNCVTVTDMECCFRDFGMFNDVVDGLQLSNLCKMSVWRVLFFKPRINWSLMLTLGMSVLQAGQLNSQSMAREHILKRKSFIDSPSVCKRLPKFIQ